MTMIDNIERACESVASAKCPRVGHFIGSLKIGGAQRQVINLLNELPEGRGVLITLSEQPGALAVELKKGIPIVSSSARWRTLPIDIWRLARKLRELKLEVLQTHMFWANFVGVISAKLAGIPVIVTTDHGLRPNRPRWAGYIERHVISQLADSRIFVSDELRQRRGRECGAQAEKLCTIPNGTLVRSQKQLNDHSPLLIGAVGRMIEAKDFPTLLMAAEILRVRNVDFRLVIVGDGRERSRLEAEIKHRRLADVVDLPGTSVDVQAWLERFDIYVISSTHEGQPLSLLEAMAHGLPIVATNVGGIPRTIEQGTEGLLVPPGDPRRLADAIATLARDIDLRRRLGVAARNRVAKDFSVSASLSRHLELYMTVLAEKETLGKHHARW
jgi:glycosyltransferase involved in cell wall biosynthesis